MGKMYGKNPRIIERLYIQPKLQSREFSTRIELYFTINRVKSIVYLYTMYLYVIGQVACSPNGVIVW